MTNSMFDAIAFDIAFSFAGEDRAIVQEIYECLTKEGFRIFYDNAFQSQLVGADLYRGLRSLYRNKAIYVACFISENYAKKAWTNLEFSAIKERMMDTFFATDFLIPILLGDADILEDIPSYFGFYKHRTVSETVELLKNKINSSINMAHLTENIDNFIDFLCPQIRSCLNAHNIPVTLSDTPGIIEPQKGGNMVFGLSIDATLPAPCILIEKYRRSANGVIQKPSFPLCVVTWNRYPNLSFSACSFVGKHIQDIKNGSLHDLVGYLSTILELEIATGGNYG